MKTLELFNVNKISYDKNNNLQSHLQIPIHASD